jgi:type I restriction enzyme S subunit
MARALFKAWFVDFEPVRAKMEGRWQRGQSLLGLPAHLYDLFPDRLVDSELGEIPEGWGVATLGNVAENPRRSVQPYSIPPDTPYIALEHMPRRCIALSDWGTAEGIESNKFEFRKGEILFGKLRPYFHKVGVAPVDGVCSTDIVVVCPRTPHLFAFVLCVVSSDDFVEFTNAGSTGTKMPRTSWADMARYEIALPPDALAQAFNGIVRRQVDRLIAAVHESRTLAALRDALLPKLIRGEIRVKDAERFLEGEGIMSQALRVSHVGFSDESYWNVGRYRSLGLVTTSVDLHASLENELLCLLEKSEVREFKWKKLDGAKERFAAIKMCEFAIENALARKLRVDVLIWDIQDSRHNVPGRDDIANLQRMYYHLFRNVLRARWPNDAVWRLHPDEHTALDWETMRDCLENASVTVEREPSLFTGGEFRIRLRREFGIEEVRPIPSDQHPLLQLADLFAGLAAFSHERFDEYQKWLHTASPKPPLVNEAKACVDPSRASQERFQVLKKFDEACKKRKLGVSLKTKQGLWTPDPQNPINFWLYEPQHPEDKAPQKAKRSV